jgi:outer membrane beta-barrel protein
VPPAPQGGGRPPDYDRPMRSFASALVLVALGSGAAAASEPERAAVRNRLYSMAGKLEVSANAGLTPVEYLTDHKSLALGVAYNLSEQLALELDAGYAISSHTSVAKAAGAQIAATDPAKGPSSSDDFSDLWQMTWNAELTLRWAPIYGKISLAAELPVHFQAYVLAGGGVARVVKDSLVYCIGTPASRQAATCDSGAAGQGPNALTPLHESAAKPVVALGGGLRFFVNRWEGLRLEVRDLAFPDSYRVGIDRAAAEGDQAALGAGAPSQGQSASRPGFTHLVFARIGAVFTF